VVLAAVEAVTQADPVGAPRRHDADVAAQAAAGKSVHAASPLKLHDFLVAEHDAAFVVGDG